MYLKKKKNNQPQLLMVLWLIQLVFTHIFCLCLQEIWGYKARRAWRGRRNDIKMNQTLLAIWFQECPALPEGNCLRGKFSLNKFYCFQIIANKSVSSPACGGWKLREPTSSGWLTSCFVSPPRRIDFRDDRANMMEREGLETRSLNFWILRQPLQTN